jgi:hypothetical protein
MSFSDVEDMPFYERRQWIKMLVEQKEKEKEAVEGTGGKKGMDIRRIPIPGEGQYGATDLEKMGIDPNKLARLGGPSKQAANIAAKTKGVK